MTGYTVMHIGRSTRQDGPDWTPKERAMDETEMPERIWGWRNADKLGSLHGWNESRNPRSMEYVRADIHAALTAERDALAARVKAMTAALEFYADQATDCRKITSEGDAARKALDKDGGDRARFALTGEAS